MDEVIEQKMGNIATYPKNCKGELCHKKGIILSGHKDSYITVGLVICDHCGREHDYEMHQGRLTSYVLTTDFLG